MGKVSWWRTMGATATWTEKMIGNYKDDVCIKIGNKMIPKENL